MCGIVGIWHRQQGASVERKLLVQMTDALKHRGPDDSDYFVSGEIGLGHRRLSILDLSPAGRQPMMTPDERYVLVFNGEIYNYRELQEQYLAGRTFHSTSDTEVLLYLLVERGLSILPELRGMFALALWDTRDQELLLVRDPLGKKPLYIVETPELFLFASEPKALLTHPAVARTADQTTVAPYLLFEYTPAPATGWQTVRQVPAGSWMRVSRTQHTSATFWQPRFMPKSVMPERAALRRLDELLHQAVSRRLVADVPVGLFLSGGLDSTTIGWYLRQCTRAPLHSFSVGFAERSFDESSFATHAASALELTHHATRFTRETFRALLPEVISMLDIPLADASLLPTYAVSHEARRLVTVVLDGDGSDELFGGYGTFQAAAVAERLPRLPRAVIDILTAASQLLPTQYGYFSWDFKLKSFLRGVGYPLAVRNQIWLGSFSDRELADLLVSTERLPQLFNDILSLTPALRGLPVFDQVSLLTLTHYLQNDILVKLDRASMAASIEARTPFLDVDVVDFALQLPVALKRDKYLLKQLMRGRIPDRIIDRPKQGFGIPLGYWLRGPLADWAAMILNSEKLREDGFWRPAYVERLLTQHRQGRADHRKKLWTLLIWQLWYDHHVKRVPIQELVGAA